MVVSAALLMCVGSLGIPGASAALNRPTIAPARQRPASTQTQAHAKTVQARQALSVPRRVSSPLNSSARASTGPDRVMVTLAPRHAASRAFARTQSGHADQVGTLHAGRGSAPASSLSSARISASPAALSGTTSSTPASQASWIGNHQSAGVPVHPGTPRLSGLRVHRPLSGRSSHQRVSAVTATPRGTITTIALSAPHWATRSLRNGSQATMRHQQPWTVSFATWPHSSTRTTLSAQSGRLDQHWARWRSTHPTRARQVMLSRAALSHLSPRLIAQLSQHSSWQGWAGGTTQGTTRTQRIAQQTVHRKAVVVHEIRTVRVAALQARSTQWAGSTTATFYITGYVATGSRTATGTWPHWGTIAVDPRVIPLGTTVYIDGLGYFRAEDTGGGVIGLHIDVFCTSVGQAYGLTGYRSVTYTP